MKKASLFILPFFLIFVSLAYSADVKAVRVDRLNVPSFVGYVPNEIVVKFDPSITDKMDKTKAPKGLMGIPSLDRVGVRYKTISILPQFPKAKKKMYRGKVLDLSGWYKIKFEDKVDVEAVVKEYKNIPGVIDAQPIGIHTLYTILPNDPCFDDAYWKQWHLNQANDVDIDAPEAWNIETGYEDIVVAVLDTGVRYFHKDLGGYADSCTDGNIWINWAEKNGVSDQDDDNNNYIDDWIGYDFVVDAPEDTCGYFLGIPICPCLSDEDCGITNDGTEVGKDNDPRDFNGHGTHVAGIVAAITNNNYGTASTAGGWGDGSRQAVGNGVKIMPLRICWSADYLFYGEVGLCRMDFAAEALYYAADNGAKFVNASWGSDSTGGIPDAIDYFLSTGGILFKAAGNDSSQSADYINSRTDDGIVSVAATDSNDCKADFSTYGDWVDISAPGVDILSSYHTHSDPGPDYVAFLSGTSMASPLGLSVAALIWSQNPNWQAAQVVQKLYDSADNIDDLSCNLAYVGKLGAGRVNAFNAVNIDCVDNDGDGYTTCEGDCDDNDADVNPGETEVCDGKDNNCDGQVDEGVTITFYLDYDEDSYGNPTSSIESCSAPAGYVNDNTDCNDYNPDVHPGATEDCGDSIDNDCDGFTDCYDSDCSDDPICTCNSNGICEQGEDCSSCPNDCIGKFTGSPSKRYCCGDGTCEQAEDKCNCSVDCGYDIDIKEGKCSDGIDNDCDGDVDCDDTDCSDDTACICLPKDAECNSKSDCCSNKCVRGVCK